MTAEWLKKQTDEQLLALEREARQKAHDAPRSDGWVGANDAWSRFGSEWCDIYGEVRRRGLQDRSSMAAELEQEAKV